MQDKRRGVRMESEWVVKKKSGKVGRGLDGKRRGGGGGRGGRVRRRRMRKREEYSEMQYFTSAI